MSGRSLGPGSLRKDARGRYVLDYRDENRVKRQKTLSEDRRVAERMRADIIRRRDLAERGLSREEGMDRPFAEIVEAFLVEFAATRAPSTARRFRDELGFACAFLGRVRVRDVTPAAVMRWRRDRLAPGGGRAERTKAGVSVRTANIGTNAVRACCEWARRAGLIAQNPCADLRPLANPESTWRKHRRAMTEDEGGRFIEAAATFDADRERRWSAEKSILAGTKGPTWGAKVRRRPMPQAVLWRVFVTVGLRLGEAAAATWGDFDDADRAIRLRAATTKGRRPREVPLPPALAAAVTALRALQAAVRGRPTTSADPLFPSPTGETWRPEKLRRDLWVILKRAGVERVDDRGRSLDVHALRATATTRMLRHGVNLPIVMEVVGHRDPRLTLKHYTDLRLNDTRAALDGLPEPLICRPAAEAERTRAAVGGAIAATIRRPGGPGAETTTAADSAESQAATVVAFQSGRQELNLRPSAPKASSGAPGAPVIRGQEDTSCAEKDDFSPFHRGPFE